ncbi:hypothetical protein HRbin12_01636 [bacterium HR12]|nr:hypothetical protein HRbin12_01636 [bacterium HR12]
MATTGVSLVLLGLRVLKGGPSGSVSRTALGLVSLQGPGFLLLELIERHFDVGLAVSDPGVSTGLLMQALVALGIAILVRGFVRAVEVVASLLRRRRSPARVLRIRYPAIPPRAGVDLLVGTRRRAPPGSLSA